MQVSLHKLNHSLHCLALSKELDVKNISLKEHENLVNYLGEQLEHLQRSLQAREASHMQMRDEVIELRKRSCKHYKAGANQDCELRRILEEVSPKNIEKMNKLLSSKDEEIAKLRDEIRIMSAHWKFETKELESQKGERKEKDLNELRDQLAMKKQESCSNTEKQANFWESSGFKFVASRIVASQNLTPFGSQFNANPFASLLESSFPPGTPRHIVDAFRYSDKDGNGFIDYEELKAVLSTRNHGFSLRTIHLLMYFFTASNTRLMGT
ncbi:hypothetical protein Syun_004506 [Stephania yunnanensis]|uniref:EF-hand domain-containing protein n=1 Tax=Stephania yunnanensis TaxID=152371 RepID=A0AAP0L7B4_9MAGN